MINLNKDVFEGEDFLMYRAWAVTTPATPEVVCDRPAGKTALVIALREVLRELSPGCEVEASVDHVRGPAYMTHTQYHTTPSDHFVPDLWVSVWPCNGEVDPQFDASQRLNEPANVERIGKLVRDALAGMGVKYATVSYQHCDTIGHGLGVWLWDGVPGKDGIWL